ncbi:MAG: hypothetical protein E7437_05020 [Ruminococcaceae bacterium]|nr:hypothetical protein [Oscillospiraceae bacterium]
MKNAVKRSLSFFLALVLCLGLLAGIGPTQVQAAYIYNWGAREDTADQADFQRSTAEEWFASQGTSYAALSQYPGGTGKSDVPNSELYRQLHDLMHGAQTSYTTYDGTKELYRYTDCQNGGGMVSSFYSGIEVGPGWDGSFNREHTWPQSKSLNGKADGGQDVADIMVIRPATNSENSRRSNTAYGVNYYDPNDESGGKHNLHGDVVRAILYGYVRWENTQYMWGADGVMESPEVLLAWLEEDPVDTWELARNDVIEGITGTRNVFVDYPELGFLLFGAEVPVDYITPSGEGGGTSYSVTATVNNAAWGAVSVSGKTLTAVPATGYYAAGYTVLSGSAQVSQTGNTFKVVPASDCTIRINFAQKTATTVRFVENGTATQTLNTYSGDLVTLPQATQDITGYSFVGWAEGTLPDTTDRPDYDTPGTQVTGNGQTYYALYTYSVGGTGITEYVKTDISQITPGTPFVITSSKDGTVYALPNGTISKNPVPKTLSVTGDKLTGDPDDTLLWQLGGSDDAWTLHPYGDPDQWLFCKDDNAGVGVGTGSNNTFQVSEDHLYNIGTGRYLGVYVNNPDWRCYTSSTSTNIKGQILGLYIKTQSGSLYYTTTASGVNPDPNPDPTPDPEPEPTVTVSFRVPAGVTPVAAMECTQAGITLPTAGAPQGYTFLGWTTQPVTDTQTLPQALTGAYQAQADTTLYALYSYTKAPEGQTANVFTKYTGTITEGDYVIYYSDALAASVNDGGRLNKQAVTVTGNTITKPDAALIWHIAPTSDGYYTLYNAKTQGYAASTGAKNKARLDSTVTDNTKWSISGTSTYEFVNLVNSSQGINANLRQNGTYGYACYHTSTGGALTLYKGVTGITCYTTLTSVACVDGAEYTDFAKACAESGGKTVKLLQNVESTLVLSQDLHLDLGGYSLTAEVTANGYRIYAMDSVTDTFEASDYGHLTLTGAEVSAKEGYVAAQENGTWSFHRYQLRLTAISLRPGQDALGYRAQFFGDPVACSLVTGYGMNLTAQKTVTKTREEALENGQSFTLRLSGILALGGGETPITASAFVNFAEATGTTPEHTTSLKTCILIINDKWQSLTAGQQTALRELYETYRSTIAPWLADRENNLEA